MRRMRLRWIWTRRGMMCCRLEMGMEPPIASSLEEQNSALSASIRVHQSTLESLKEADPDFCQHLAQMDENMLDLGALDDVDDAVSQIQHKRRALDDVDDCASASGSETEHMQRGDHDDEAETLIQNDQKEDCKGQASACAARVC